MATSVEPAATQARPYVEFRPLLRAVGIASDGRKLIVATAGLLALSAGWSFLGWLFGLPAPWFAPMTPGTESGLFSSPSAESIAVLGSVVAEPFRILVGSFSSLFAQGSNARSWSCAALMALWGVVIWSLAGGAIARMAVIQAASDLQVGLISSLRFALRKASSLIGAPLTPLFTVAFFAGLLAICGLISRVPWSVGAGFSWIFGLVPLALGLIMALILVGLMLGWPLMHATVAAEGEDAPDALSRSYSYVNQRLARYAIHLLASGLIGMVGLCLVIAFAQLVVGLTDWGVGLGGARATDPSEQGRAFWRGIVGLVVHAWVYSYFWTASSIIYLILRRDVDGTPWHDIDLPTHEADTFAGDLDSGPGSPAKVAEPVEVG